MNLIHSFMEIQIRMAEIRNLRQGFITNFYPDPFKTGLWMYRNELYVEHFSESVLFIRKTIGHTSVFFCATNSTSLDFSLKHLSEEGIYVLEVISNELTNPIHVPLQQNGFIKYTSLIRMFRINSSSEVYHPEYSPIRNAKRDEIEEIQNLIAQNFDVYAEQAPALEELEHWVAESKLIVFELHSVIAGFLIYDLIGVTQYLRFWYVDQNHRNKKVGSALLNEFSKRGRAAKRQLLWVMNSNENAIMRYMHFGFKKEEMYDSIFVKNNN